MDGSESAQLGGHFTKKGSGGERGNSASNQDVSGASAHDHPVVGPPAYRDLRANEES